MTIRLPKMSTSVTFDGGALVVENFAFLDAKNPGVVRVR